MKTGLRNSGLCILLAIIFSSAALHTQEKKTEKSLLWKISGNGLKQPSYLFGTYHLLGEKFLAEVPEIQQPFAKAKGVVVEFELDSAKMISVMMAKAIMKDKKISTLLSPEDFLLVDSVLKSLSGYSLKSFDMFKPAQITLMITVSQAKTQNDEQLKKYEGVPLDIHFANAAKKDGKTVSALETMDEQFDMLYNHETVEQQASQLVELIKQNDLAAKSSVEMTRLYFDKDLDGLARQLESMPHDIIGNMDYMLKDRNERWVKILPDLMKSGSQFIAVGAGHLPGKDRLISLLKKQGYNVTAVTK